MLTEHAIAHFGGVKKLADALDLWPQAVYRWGDVVPEGTAYKLQVLTKNKLLAVTPEKRKINKKGKK